VRTLLDDSLVGILLLASALYAIYSLGPRRLRGRLLAGMAAALRGLSAFPAFGALAQRLRAASADPKGACGGCAGCGPAQPAALPTDHQPPADAAVGRNVAIIAEDPRALDDP
jgi:hypothetical protein